MALAANYREQYTQYSRSVRAIAQQYGQKPIVRTSIEVLLTLLTISFFAVFAIRPTVNTIAQLISDIQAQREIQSQLNAKIENLKKAQSIYSRESARLAALDQAIPRGPQPDQMVRQIEGLVAHDGLVLGSLTVDKTPLSGTITKEQTKKTGAQFEVSFLVKGEYQKITAFLKDIEELRRTINITTISISVSKKATEPGVILLTIGAQVPYYPDQQ